MTAGRHQLRLTDRSKRPPVFPEPRETIERPLFQLIVEEFTKLKDPFSGRLLNECQCAGRPARR